MQIPHLPARLLSLLPFCSPINDLLLLLLRVSKPPSPLIPSVVTQTIRMLDPYSALGKPGHAAAEEFLRGVIEICLAVPRAQGGPSPGNPFGAAGGGASEEPSFEWRDTTLARKIADEGSVRTLLDWMLAGVEEDALNEKLEAELEILKAEEEAEAGDATGETTPKASSPTTASPPSPSLPDPAGEGTRVEGEEELDETPQEHELRTSSLIASIAVLVELIRKNNSDFVEQQMLAWARRKEAAQQEKELLEAEGAQVLPHSGFDDEEEREMDDRGPSIVDLGGMLSLLAGQIDGFQRLIKKPRTSVRTLDLFTFLIVPHTCASHRFSLSPPSPASALPSLSNASESASSTLSSCTAPTCPLSTVPTAPSTSTLPPATSLAAGKAPTTSPSPSPVPPTSPTSRNCLTAPTSPRRVRQNSHYLPSPVSQHHCRRTRRRWTATRRKKGRTRRVEDRRRRVRRRRRLSNSRRRRRVRRRSRLRPFLQRTTSASVRTRSLRQARTSATSPLPLPSTPSPLASSPTSLYRQVRCLRPSSSNMTS